MKVWTAHVALDDLQNEPMEEFIGVFSSEAKAKEVVAGWETGRVEEHEVDEIPSWHARDIERLKEGQGE